MTEVLKLVASFVLFFGGSLLVSYGVFSLIAARRHRFDLSEGASVRLVGPGGAYRCQFLGYEDGNLRFSSPIQADRYVPLRVGERIFVQCPGKGCMVSFRSTVIERSSESHNLILEAPQHVRRSERRTEGRLTAQAGEDALVDGELAQIVDVSAAGACFLTQWRPDPGQRLSVVLPSNQLDAYAWTLDSSPAQDGYKVRVRFTEPLAGLTSSRRSR